MSFEGRFNLGISDEVGITQDGLQVNGKIGSRFAKVEGKATFSTDKTKVTLFAQNHIAKVGVNLELDENSLSKARAAVSKDLSTEFDTALGSVTGTASAVFDVEVSVERQPDGTFVS